MGDEDRRREFDPRSHAEGQALGAGAGAAGEVPQDQTGDGQVDLAEQERLEDRFEPEGEGGGRAEEGQGQRARDQAGGEGDEAGEQERVARQEQRLQGRERDPGRGDEQDRREGRVGRREPPLGDREAVQVAAADDGRALGAVDQQVGHRGPLQDAQGGEGAERDREKEQGQQGREGRHRPFPHGGDPMPLPAAYACFLAVLAEDHDPEPGLHEHLDGTQGVAQRVMVRAVDGGGTGRGPDRGWRDGCCAHVSMVEPRVSIRYRSSGPIPRTSA